MVIERADAGGVDDQPVREAVADLVVDDVRHVAAVHVAACEQVHLHARRVAVGRRREVGVVEALAVVDLGADVVVAEPGAARVDALEVARRLVEADRRLREVLRVAADEHVDVGRRLELVGRARRRDRGVPRAAARGARRGGRERCAARVEPVAAARAALRDLDARAALLLSRGRGPGRWGRCRCASTGPRAACRRCSGRTRRAAS